MKKRALVLGGVLLLGAAAGSAYYGVFTPKTPAERLLHDASALAESFAQPIVVEPFDLAARVGPGWQCEARMDDRVTRCRSGDWAVSWRVEPEEKKAPIETLIAEAERASHRAHDMDHDTPGAADVLARRTLAGFSGYLAVSQTMRRPHLAYTFTGWFEDPKRGRLRLNADGDTSSAEEVVQSRLDALAVILTTAAHGRAAGPAPSWPTFEERQALSELEKALKELAADDAAPSAWLSAARRATSKGRALPDQRPGLTELLQKRCDALAERGDVEAMGVAVGIAKSLKEWDPGRTAPVMARLLTKANEQSKTAPAPAWTGFQIDLALTLAALGDDGPLATLTPVLEAVDPVPLLGQRPEPIQLLVDSRKRPAAYELLGVWFGGAFAKPPASTNFRSLADISADAALDSALLQGHALAMLSNRSSYGSATAKGGGIEYETPHGSSTSYPSRGVAAPDGAKTALRVCDLYADKLVRMHHDAYPALEFPLFAAVPARDRAIRTLQTWLREQKPEN